MKIFLNIINSIVIIAILVVLSFGLMAIASGHNIPESTVNLIYLSLLVLVTILIIVYLKRRKLNNTELGSYGKQPEDYFIVTVTDESVRVEHPSYNDELVYWKDIKEIKFINTDKGPWAPDLWLTLVGNDNQCMIPQGNIAFEEVYEIVSKYEGFNFENAGKSMGCTDNKEFELWRR